MILHGKHLAGSITRLGLALAGLACTFAAAEDMDRVPVPIDWSHRHLIFAKPDTPQEAIRNGTYDQWAKDYRDPRFVMALQRRLESEAELGTQATTSMQAKATRAPVLEGPSPAPSLRPPRESPVSPRVSPPHRDWNVPMGGTGAAGVGTAAVFPAKYNFDISAAPSCANDFVIYPATSAGVTGSGAFASRTGTVTNAYGAGKTATITNGTRVLTLTVGASNSGLTFVDGGNTAAGRNATAANLAAAIARNGLVVGVTATSNGTATMTITATSQGTGANAITVAENSGGFSWSGSPLTGGSGTAGQPTIFAVNQLYSSCASATAGPPMAFWAYNTGTGATVTSSPIISLDGTQVAFVQSSGGVASLVLLKWSAVTAGTTGAPAVPTSVAAASYKACTAPCMTSFSLAANNTNSSPYLYYDTDELWVGDDAGVMHKFTNIFLGATTPAEVVTGGWPATVDAGLILSSPIYDKVGNLVYVGTQRTPDTGGFPGTAHGGRLHTVNNGTGAVLASGQLAGNPVAGTNTGSMGVGDAVIVDQSARRIYAFVATDTTTAAAACNNNTANVECHAAYQFNADASISGSTGLAKANFGRGQIWSRVGHAGVFDNAYYTSASAANPSGNLYVCGSVATGASSRQPTLWKIPITANAMGAPTAAPALVGADTSDASGGGGTCSPITDVQNGTHNYIYVSVPEQGNRTGCAGSCVYVYDLSAIATWTTANATAGLAAAGGTSGIVIDNTSAIGGASQIYYSTLTSPGGAVQASQAALN